MRPNHAAIRVGAAVRQAELGPRSLRRHPRLGMIKDMETLGVHLLGGYTAESSR